MSPCFSVQKALYFPACAAVTPSGGYFGILAFADHLHAPTPLCIYIYLDTNICTMSPAKVSETTGVCQKVNKAIGRGRCWNNYINPCYGFNFVFVSHTYMFLNLKHIYFDFILGIFADKH